MKPFFRETKTLSSIEDPYARASMRITSYAGEVRTGTAISFSDPYFITKDYSRLIAILHIIGEEYQVSVGYPVRSLRVKTGEFGRPFVTVDVQGSKDSIESMAYEVEGQFNKRKVRLVYEPGLSAHNKYSFNTKNSHVTQEIIRTLRSAKVDTSHILENRFELFSPSSIEIKQLKRLEHDYGKPKISPCEVVPVVYNF